MNKTTLLMLYCLVLSTLLKAQEINVLVPAKNQMEQIYTYTNHSLSYNTSYRACSWLSYKLSPELYDETFSTKIKYTEDPNITVRGAEKKDYKKSGYVAGQYMNTKEVAKNETAVDESFYLSNFAPMKQGFNTHTWQKLENFIRTWATNNTLLIITGPVLTESPYATIGKNKVTVPKTFYKIVYDAQQNKAIGFLAKSGSVAGKLKSLVCSIDEIEELTGLDFFPTLPETEQKKLEEKRNTNLWEWGLVE